MQAVSDSQKPPLSWHEIYDDILPKQRGKDLEAAPVPRFIYMRLPFIVYRRVIVVTIVV